VWQQRTQVPWSLDWKPTSKLKILKSSKLILKLRLRNLFRSQKKWSEASADYLFFFPQKLKKIAKCVCSKWVVDAGNWMQLWKARNPLNNLNRRRASHHAWISWSVW
jgi:hypothetical protein